MRAKSILGMAIVVVTLAGAAPHAGGDPWARDAASPASGSHALPEPSLALAIRAMTLGFTPLPATSMGLETGRAPTGAGTDRMPSATTEIARGVYLTVMPTCLPGMDDPRRLPLSRRTGAPARR